ncbi:MAG: hypothetical protein AB1640_10910 [bacterium]
MHAQPVRSHRVETPKESEQPETVRRAKVRMAVWLLLFYLITLTWAYLTFPFLGFTSPVENVVHGVLVASPFWGAIAAALIVLRRKGRR